MKVVVSSLSSGMPVSGCRSAVSRNYISDCGALAQLGERLVCNQEVAGSIPVRSTLKKNGALVGAGFFMFVESGAYRDRTCDLLVANQALSQLS